MTIERENQLEKALKQAADEPAHRPEFFKILLDSDIYILGNGQDLPEGEITLTASSKINVVNWQRQDGAPVIPFFSSLEVLQKSIEIDESYLRLPAKTLFEITLGANLILNPKSPYGKEFLPEEIQTLLSDGVGVKSAARVVEKETKVLLGQPTEKPSKMIDSLSKLFVKHDNVKRAFVALMHDPEVDEKPHLIVGIEADGDFERVMREAGSVAADTAPKGEPVDFFRISKDDTGLSSYFLKDEKPFYERKWSAKLRSIFRKG